MCAKKTQINVQQAFGGSAQFSLRSLPDTPIEKIISSLTMNPNLGMPTGGLPQQQQQQHNFMQQMQQPRQNHMGNQVPTNNAGVAPRQGPPMNAYGQPTNNQAMQAKMPPSVNQGMQMQNAANQAQNKMNMQALPIRTYLDQTVVPILLDGKFSSSSLHMISLP